MMSKYKVDCIGNCCYRIFQRKSFLMIPYWSYMCSEVTIKGAISLIDHLRVLNNDNIHNT